MHLPMHLKLNNNKYKLKKNFKENNQLNQKRKKQLMT